MHINFSDTKKSKKEIKRILEKSPEELEKPVYKTIELDKENILQQLFNATEILKHHSSWIKNVGINNKEKEKKRFLKQYSNEKEFKPDFQFKKPFYNEKTFIQVLDELIGECEKIDSHTLDKYNANKITSEEFRRIWREIFKEMKHYVRLASNIEDRKQWKKHCLNIWEMVDNETIRNSEEKLDQLETRNNKDKNLDAKDIAHMWREELHKLGIDYNIEIRDVNGCFNIPEDQTVVVANGKNNKRHYSKTEAEILTKHELFHVARAYNGRKISEKNSLPPILGLHTGFYDKTEEGGAIYREHQTNVITNEKKFDYHLRLMAAYYTYKDFKFQKITSKLIEHGATPERSFELAARNREILRHHIYQGGYYEEWEGRGDINKLLIGKVNRSTARILEKEIGGMLGEPPVKAEDLFSVKN